MAESVPQFDLVNLREILVRMNDAVAVSDLGGVEAQTEALRAFLERGPDPEVVYSLVGEKALLEAVDGLSADVAATLASRLRAYDVALAAWRATERGD